MSDTQASSRPRRHGGREATNAADAHPLVPEDEGGDDADALNLNDPARTEDRA